MTDIATEIVQDVTNVVHTVEDKIAAIEATIAKDFTYLKREAAVIYNWLDNQPALKPFLDAALKDAEAGAAKLADASNGFLTGAVSNMAADAETFVANAFQAAGLNKANLPANMTGAAGDTIQFLEDLGKSAISTAIPKVLAAILAAA